MSSAALASPTSEALASTPERALAVAVPYLKLSGFVIGGWLMTRGAGIAAAKLSGADKDFYAAKLTSARFFAEQVLPAALGHARIVTSGASSVTEAPSRSRRWAIARPIPVPPPVTTTCFTVMSSPDGRNLRERREA